MADRSNRTGPYEKPNEPQLEDLFRVQLREMALQLRSHSVARVIAYDPATQTASVSVEILQVIKDHRKEPTPANPNPVSIQDPVVLEGIPVAWPRTSSAYLTFPLAPGDTGELHVQDRSIDLWRQAGAPVDPISAFIHMLGDAVFHPNIFPSTLPITPPTSLVATVVEGPEVHLGRGAVNLVALANLVDGIISTLDTVFRVAWVPVPNDGGAALQAAYLAAFPVAPTTVAATKTRAE